MKRILATLLVILLSVAGCAQLPAEVPTLAPSPAEEEKPPSLADRFGLPSGWAVDHLYSPVWQSPGHIVIGHDDNLYIAEYSVGKRVVKSANLNTFGGKIGFLGHFLDKKVNFGVPLGSF